jgi:hypothetical protein
MRQRILSLARNAKTAVFLLAENQCIDAGYTSLLKHFEALPSKRVKWMADLRPSKMRTVGQCSLH